MINTYMIAGGIINPLYLAKIQLMDVSGILADQGHGQEREGGERTVERVDGQPRQTTNIARGPRSKLNKG